MKGEGWQGKIPFWARLLLLLLLTVGSVEALILMEHGRDTREVGKTAPSESLSGIAATGGFPAEDAENAASALTEGREGAALSVHALTITSIPTPTPDPYPGKPDVDISSWEFLLANPDHSVSAYTPQVAYLRDIPLDARIIDPMQQFVEAAEAEGLSVVLASGYRSYEEQTWLFDLKTDQYDGDRETAATIVAKPGTSEHQTGLAADITDDYYEIKRQSLEDTALYRWMSAHCQEYGFIVRYPKDKEDVTGIIYEPWHFRYVGIPAATYIMENGLTLEEFIDFY